MNLNDIAQHYSDEDSAREFLERLRWPSGPECPHCGLVGDAYRLEARPESKKPVRKGVWKCRGCQGQFTVTVNTIFEDSHIPLHKWLMAYHLICSSKKGMSAHQLHRMLGIGYRAAWFMAHRIRYSMTDTSTVKLSGPDKTVEVDETYVGGRQRGHKGRPTITSSNKTAVVALVERRGKVRSFPVERVTINNLKPILVQHVAAEAHLMTDENNVYRFAKDKFAAHSFVTHSDNEYTRRDYGKLISTNTVEGFFSLLKRGVYGTFHHVGRQHLHRYLSEFDFRYNRRDVKDGERTVSAIKGSAGKRLMYKKPFEGLVS